MMPTHASRGRLGRQCLTRGRRLALGATVMGMALTFAIVGCTNTKDSTTSGADGATTASGTETAGGTSPVTGLQEPSSTPSTAISPSPPQSTNTQDQYEKDLPGLAEKAKAAPTDLTALQDLAISQYQTQRYAEAIATYKQMIKIKDEPVYHNNLGNVLRDAGRETDAIKEYQAAIAADPTLVVAYVNLGTLQFNQGAADAGTKTLNDGIAQTTGEDKRRLNDAKAALLKPKTTSTT